MQYGELTMDKEARGWNTQFKDGRGQWIHRVMLKDLRYNTKYSELTARRPSKIDNPLIRSHSFFSGLHKIMTCDLYNQTIQEKYSR